MNVLENIVKFTKFISNGRTGVELRQDNNNLYYCHVPFEEKDGNALIGLCAHASTIEESAQMMLGNMKNKLLVYDAYGENRREVFFYTPEGKNERSDNKNRNVEVVQ
ncbi:MAG: hypothetical protein FWC06_08695 [Treponema sp.]|nr:hypothetical protein [Treponema sp.]